MRASSNQAFSFVQSFLVAGQDVLHLSTDSLKDPFRIPVATLTMDLV